MEEQNKHIIAVVLFVLALALPFSNKAYHVDDTAFIYVADQIAKDPLRPYSFVLEWGNKAGFATHLLDTPLVMYYIALITWLFGRTELILHTAFLIFPLTAGISFYFIAKKFVKYPLIASLLIISSPTFLPQSQNLMLDVPMLSLFLLALALFIYGVDKSSHRMLLLGSLAAGFAYLAKPNAIFFMPLLALYCIIKRKAKFIWYMIIPISFIGLFALQNYLFEDKILILHYLPFLTNAKHSSISILAAYFVSNLSYTGGAAIFTLFLLFPFLLKRKNLKFFAFALLIAGIMSALLYNLSSAFVSGKYSLLQIALFFIFVSSSIFFILLVIAENYGNAKSAILSILRIKSANYNSNLFFLFAWFIGFYFLNSGISGGAVRYNTLFLPPMILSYFLMLEEYKDLIKIDIKKLLLVILAATAITGIIVAYADYDYANSYRDFAYKADIYKTKTNTIWFVGGHGFQYYMEQQGHNYLPILSNEPKKGDVIIKAIIPGPRDFSEELKKRIKLVDVVEYTGKIPIRVQNPDAHAGFYTFGGGFLPYSISSSNLENFEVYSVER